MATTIPVSNETKSSSVRTTKDGRQIRYDLQVIQQPERARACGSGAKSSADRRPVDPPPIVELRVFENNQEITFAYNANFFLHASVTKGDGSTNPVAAKNPTNPKEGFLAKIFGRNERRKSEEVEFPPRSSGLRNSADHPRPSSPPVGGIATTPSTIEAKPPPMKGAFNSHTVTAKPVVEIQEQIQKALDKLRVEHEVSKKGFGYKCKAMGKTDPVHFSIKICSIEKFDMKGLKFKRTGGDLWDFQKIQQQIVKELDL